MNDRKSPSRLGRGLASLLGDDAEMSAPAADRRSLPITFLAPGPFQPRQAMPEEALDELADSIRKHGILQPILVRPTPEMADRYQIIAGERRWRAAQRAGLHEVPVHIRSLDDVSAMAAALIENLQRQDLNAIEEAEGLRRLAVEFEMTQETVAASVGKSRSHVTNMIRLLTLPNSVQFDVRRGALSAGHARALLAHPDPSKAAMAVLARGLTVRQTEALAKAGDRAPAKQRPVAAAPDGEMLARELASHLGLRVSITTDGQKGEVRLAFNNYDQFEGIVRLLKGGDS